MTASFPWALLPSWSEDAQSTGCKWVDLKGVELLETVDFTKTTGGG
jgi:hypothetical protein